MKNKNIQKNNHHSPTLFDEKAFIKNLQTNFVGKNIKFYQSTDSTNIQAKNHFNLPDGTLFLADTQTMGKGRLGRSWESGSGCGLWFSILLKPDIALFQTSALTLIAGIAVCRVLCRLGFDAKIKWPNDIVLECKKVCGILTEASAENNKINYIVCGIGINVNNNNFDDELSKKATSLFLESNSVTDRYSLLSNILSEFELCYIDFLNHGFSFFKKEYTDFCITLNHIVSVIQNNQSVKAKACDISDTGGLIVDMNGKLTEVSSGEVSVRGIYGYI